MDIEQAERAIRELKEATREAHEATKQVREQRRFLIELIDKIQDGFEQILLDKITKDLEGFSKDLRAFQEDCEHRLSKRFDDFVQGPFDELAMLLSELRKATIDEGVNKAMVERAMRNPLVRPKR